ncbi:hypothetical protein J0S82_013776, partial [Galemys pyrenaicus]
MVCSLGLLENMASFLWTHICKSTRKGKTFAKRVNVHIECSRHLKSRDSFLRPMIENDPKKSQRKRNSGSVEAPACSPRKCTMWEPMGRSPSCWNLFPLNSLHD